MDGEEQLRQFLEANPAAKAAYDQKMLAKDQLILAKDQEIARLRPETVLQSLMDKYKDNGPILVEQLHAELALGLGWNRGIAGVERQLGRMVIEFTNATVSKTVVNGDAMYDIKSL
mmetsp:Transcript_19164/g.41392  ORF Transcript_19164/g.41392 Transcript_19164/m.41392 type:complete len:116 (+) Transcript_19164:33-380(+)|eukprot:CAMPEP_0202892110 /NCGR_PEP_ID=MMETSP1392-20130828/1934_1 /ASSEMBLY_ACC=CAM_ASM_000868 /TAXON_ID=225041 /ORGANISM="Chlamydomonas chlamydogama, Strain SAG 11-48b" /LENGTH=115 /DNA_ID=CAMNT_0049575991 /DNA_START=33 /DNA_END=380 /DNA_ORIENTATION=-